MPIELPRVHGHRGASHRDARRIGPDLLGREPLHDHCSCQPVRSAPVLRLRQTGTFRPAHSRRRLVPSGGRFGSEELLLPPGGSKGVSLLHLRTTYPCGLPFRRLPSGVFVPPILSLAAISGLCFHTFRPTWSLPIAARLSRHLRFARLTPKGLPRAFSDAAAGIAATPIRLNFPVHFQAVRPGSCKSFFPFDR